MSYEVEAYNLCTLYAIKKGFSSHKRNIRRVARNNIRKRDIFSSNEGFQYDDPLCEDKNIGNWRQKLITRF